MRIRPIGCKRHGFPRAMSSARLCKFAGAQKPRSGCRIGSYTNKAVRLSGS